VVGMGGIASGRDAADFLRAGATCVAVGTESFRDPAAGVRVRTELAAAAEVVRPDRPVVSSGDPCRTDQESSLDLNSRSR
jgi:Dihydroorotate dehydrogenase